MAEEAPEEVAAEAAPAPAPQGEMKVAHTYMGAGPTVESAASLAQTPSAGSAGASRLYKTDKPRPIPCTKRTKRRPADLR